jgi:hypothetical protein
VKTGGYRKPRDDRKARDFWRSAELERPRDAIAGFERAVAASLTRSPRFQAYLRYAYAVEFSQVAAFLQRMRVVRGQESMAGW